MRVHYMLNHQWGNFKCDLCDYFAHYSTDFAYHVLTKHAKDDGDKKVTALCPECELAVPVRIKESIFCIDSSLI